MELKHNRKRIRLKSFNYSTPSPYHIIICSRKKIPIFINDEFNHHIIECLLNERNNFGLKIYVYCLMPNHLHLLLSPSIKDISISRFIGGFKSKANRIAWDYGIFGKLWQSRFYDHIIRKREGLDTIGQYILNNPVRKGLADKWQDYKFLGLPDSWF